MKLNIFIITNIFDIALMLCFAFIFDFICKYRVTLHLGEYRTSIISDGTQNLFLQNTFVTDHIWLIAYKIIQNSMSSRLINLILFLWFISWFWQSGRDSDFFLILRSKYFRENKTTYYLWSRWQLLYLNLKIFKTTFLTLCQSKEI